MANDKELKNHERQIQNAREVDQFMRDKYTNQELYEWMSGQISGTYFQAYQLAYDVAKRAERAFRYELGLSDSNFIQFGYWDSLKKGLLAGEKLGHDLKRMEMAYLDQNKREYEITKHVSLLSLDPIALINLRQTGRCEVMIPELLFDFDYPGHYLRRIRSVSLTIPCVTGPYTGVNCTLTLLKSSVRHTTGVSGGYNRDDGSGSDSRFSDSFGAIQSVVTSSGQNDSGLFETNLRDERYLPFEGAGAISTWRLEMPNEFRAFDYDTISDVILDLRYTARDGGGVLKNRAIDNLKSQVEAAEAAGMVRLFSVRHEFPSKWAIFKKVVLSDSTPVAGLTLNFGEEHYPFWSRGRLGAVKQLELFARTDKDSVEITDKPDETANMDTLDFALGNLRAGKLAKIPLPSPTGEFTLYFNDNSMEDLWLALTWGKKE